MSSDRFIQDEADFDGWYKKSVFQAPLFGYRKYRVHVLLLLAIGFIGRFLIIANANIIGIWVDTLCAGPSCPQVPSIVADFTAQQFVYLLLAAASAGLLLTLVFRIGFSRLSAYVVSQLYDELTYRASRYPMTFFDRTPVGRIVTRFSSDYGNLFRLIGGPLADFVNTGFDLIAMVLLIGILHYWFIPVMMLTILVNWIVYRFNVNALRLQRRNLSRSRSPSIAHFSETVQGASTIRTFAREQEFCAQFASKDEMFLSQKLRTVRASLLFSLQMNSLTAIVFLVTGLIGWYLVRTGQAGVGTLGTVMALVALSSVAIQTFFEWMANFEDALTGLERLNEYLLRPLEVGAKLPAYASFPTGHPRRSAEVLISHRTDASEVSIQNLSFAYTENVPVLDAISAEICQGEKIGIIGRTGSGKTSLIQAIYHLYQFKRGYIEIDRKRPALEFSASEPTNQTDLQAFRSQVALITQDPVLFRGSLRDNLDLARRRTDEEIREAIRRVGLGSWFTDLQEDLDFQIEERGRNLSLGEKQMLCLARCLLQDASVIIMDEATSSIDPQTEKTMVAATEKIFHGRTMILIAHRLSTVAHCDRIIWLENGKIRMIGPAKRVLNEFSQPTL